MDAVLVVLTCLLATQVSGDSVEKLILHPDAGLNIHEFLQKYGYPLETHHVQTEDGYILTLHRIPYGNKNNITTTNETRPAVLIMHGLLSSSMDWVNLGSTKALALLLANAGYDVWLGNQRGNMWSKNHTHLNPVADKGSFYAYSFNEMGLYDQPAMIDRILNVTGQERIHYVGHSCGTTAFFVMASERPEYNSKIKLAIALSPVVFQENIKQPVLKWISKNLLLVNILIEQLKISEVFPYNPIVAKLLEHLCADGSPMQEICADFFYAISGYDPPELNKSFMTVITSNFPAGASMRTIVHYLQGVNSKQFRKYDHGPLKNLKIYGQFTPPPYNLDKVTAPVALYYSQNDLLLSPMNVELLANKLPNVVLKRLIEYANFSHSDFVWANDIYELLNKDVLEKIQEY